MQKFRVFIAFILTLTFLTHTKQSQAAVGAIVSPGVLVAGLVIGGGGIVGGIALSTTCGGLGGAEETFCNGMSMLLAGAVVILGLIVLDGEQEVQFRELNDAEAAKIGISQADLAVYNSEIDQANMLIADVKSELSKVAKPSAKDSVAAWNDVKDLVSPATYATMQKIVSQK